MAGDAMDLSKLAEPFPAADIEWRVQSGGKKSDGKLWAKVVAYITSRAIMDRLDAVVGPENWRNEFREAPSGGVLCGISIRVGDEWVTKWDGAENTDFEAVKGGLSAAQKRAGVQWGIGRYLYLLPEGWANIHDGGRLRGCTPKKAGGDWFNYDPPSLPGWALPARSGAGPRTAPVVDHSTGEILEDAPDPTPTPAEGNAAGLPDFETAEAAKILRRRIARAMGSGHLTADQHGVYFAQIQRAEDSNDMSALQRVQDSLNELAASAKGKA